jgi:hypothetical protein
MCAPERGHLDRYREVCGFGRRRAAADRLSRNGRGDSRSSTPSWTHPRFVVRIMGPPGLIHVAERESGRRASFRLIAHSALQDLDRGSPRRRSRTRGSTSIPWSKSGGQRLAGKVDAAPRDGPQGGMPAARSARQALRYEKPGASDAVEQRKSTSPRAVGRRYGWLSGDLNPIHLADRGARMFGFERAVAHGMWSMARTLAAARPWSARAAGAGHTWSSSSRSSCPRSRGSSIGRTNLGASSC